MCSLGLICLAFFVPFYWRKKYPIWTLFDNEFGKQVRDITMLLSWIWMTGVIASQVIGASYILNIINLPIEFSILITIFLITLISLLPIDKMARLLTLLLITSTFVLIFGILKFSSLNELFYVFKNVPREILNQNPLTNIGIIIPTILITVLGMDFNQFIVQGKTIKKAMLGTLIAGIILFFISFIPVLIVFTATKNNIVLSNIDGKQIIPYILMSIGTILGSKLLGNILVFSLLTLSIGSGSALTKISVNTFSSFKFIPKAFRNKKNVTMLNILVILFLAITGKTIISLIVCFYIIYITGVIVPFTIYISGISKKINISNKNIFLSSILGSASSFFILIGSKINLLPVIIINNLEFFMLTIGIVISLISLIIMTIKTYDIIGPVLLHTRKKLLKGWR